MGTCERFREHQYTTAGHVLGRSRMRVCIPSADSDRETSAARSFEEADLFDFYDIRPQGSSELVARIRPCMNGCSDPVEVVSMRGADAVIVAHISPHSLVRLRNAGVRILIADAGSVGELIESYVAGRLKEVTGRDFGRLARNRPKGV